MNNIKGVGSLSLPFVKLSELVCTNGSKIRRGFLGSNEVLVAANSSRVINSFDKADIYESMMKYRELAASYVKETLNAPWSTWLKVAALNTALSIGVVYCFQYLFPYKSTALVSYNPYALDPYQEPFFDWRVLLSIVMYCSVFSPVFLVIHSESIFAVPSALFLGTIFYLAAVRRFTCGTQEEAALNLSKDQLKPLSKRELRYEFAIHIFKELYGVSFTSTFEPIIKLFLMTKHLSDGYLEFYTKGHLRKPQTQLN